MAFHKGSRHLLGFRVCCDPTHSRWKALHYNKLDMLLILPNSDGTGCKEGDAVVCVALHFCHNVEGFQVWVATVINKATLVTHIGGVYA